MDCTASASTINGGYAWNGARLRRGMSRSWTVTEDEAMSIKRDDLDAGRINDQWRVIFKWIDGEPHEVRIVDYH
jgi:hypothetical protein